MQVEVVSASPDAIVLGAPLEPNINHRETVFGGSASALAILSAWSLLHTRLQAEQVACQLVIQRNVMEYNLPIDAAFHAKSAIARPEDWPKFLLMLSRRGRARITVSAVLELNGSPVGRFSGEFVALRR
jgi:thioesterase domain-containing protein